MPVTNTPLTKQKQEIAKEIVATIEAHGWTQTEASYVTKDAASQISLIYSGAKNPAKLRGFSLERLLILLSRLGRDVTVTIGPKKKNTVGIVKVRRAA